MAPSNARRILSPWPLSGETHVRGIASKIIRAIFERQRERRAALNSRTNRFGDERQALSTGHLKSAFSGWHIGRGTRSDFADRYARLDAEREKRCSPCGSAVRDRPNMGWGGSGWRNPAAGSWGGGWQFGAGRAAPSKNGRCPAAWAVNPVLRRVGSVSRTGCPDLLSLWSQRRRLRLS
jgi:hypothetical protein